MPEWEAEQQPSVALRAMEGRRITLMGMRARAVEGRVSCPGTAGCMGQVRPECKLACVPVLPVPCNLPLADSALNCILVYPLIILSLIILSNPLWFPFVVIRVIRGSLLLIIPPNSGQSAYRPQWLLITSPLLPSPWSCGPVVPWSFFSPSHPHL